MLRLYCRLFVSGQVLGLGKRNLVNTRQNSHLIAARQPGCWNSAPGSQEVDRRLPAQHAQSVVKVRYHGITEKLGDHFQFFRSLFDLGDDGGLRHQIIRHS
jgi:hypothetical protein